MGKEEANTLPVGLEDVTASWKDFTVPESELPCDTAGTLLVKGIPKGDEK